MQNYANARRHNEAATRGLWRLGPFLQKVERVKDKFRCVVLGARRRRPNRGSSYLRGRRDEGDQGREAPTPQ